MRAFESRQVGKQINVGGLMLINEVELSIYRFLASKAKMLKSRLDRMISHWAINAWQVIVKPRPVLDRTLTGP